MQYGQWIGRTRGDPFVPPDDDRNAGDKLQRAPGHDERRHERCGSAVGRKLVGGSCLVHNAECVNPYVATAA